MFKILFFKVLINLSAATDFPSLYVEYTSMLFIFKKSLKVLLLNSLTWSTHILFGFLRPLDSASLFSEIILLNTLTILVPFLSFIGITQAYLLNKSIAHNKYLILLLYLLSDCISAQSTPQILSLNDE